MHLKSVFFLAFLLVTFVLVGCDGPQEQTSNESKTSQSDKLTSKPIEAPVEKICGNCGTVVSIEPITTKGESSGAGAVIGAVAGGLLGNQIGGGSGKDAATVVGAVGGAVAGNEIEKRRNSVTYFAVTIKMEDGSQHVANVNSIQGLDIGSKVEVNGNDLRLL